MSRKFDVDERVWKLFDGYVHGSVSRREFLDRAARFTAGGVSAATLLSVLGPDYALAQQVDPDDKSITVSYKKYSSPKGAGVMRGYFARPSRTDHKLPGVVVIHENRGLNPYIEDVARRLAVAGFIAFAPDALTPLGGYPGNDDEGRSMQRSMDRGKIEQDFIAAARFLKAHELCNGKLGAVGFCFGGYITNLLAATLPEQIDAAVPFYGTPAKAELAGKVRGPVLLQFAEQDPRVNATWPEYEALLKKNGADYQAHVYPGVNHGFHNDSTARYDREAAELAWSRTLEFFARHLG